MVLISLILALLVIYIGIGAITYVLFEFVLPTAEEQRASTSKHVSISDRIFLMVTLILMWPEFVISLFRK
jgi:hypothetical protein